MMIVERVLTADRSTLELQIVRRARYTQIVKLHVTLEALRTGIILKRLDVEAKVNYLTQRPVARVFHRPRNNLSQIAGAPRVIAVPAEDCRNAVTSCRV